MATIYNVEIPKDAWELVAHYISNQLLLIQQQQDEFGVWLVGNLSVTERTRIAAESRLRLIGALSVINFKLKLSGHESDALRVEVILAIIIEQDTNLPITRELIHRRHEELRGQ